MSRRRRSLVFLMLAVLAAGGAAAIADGYGSSVARGYGPLRPVVVLAADLRPGVRIGAREADAALSIRRVPERFIPAGALATPLQALGLVPKQRLLAGSYLLAFQLDSGRGAKEPSDKLPDDRRPVEISVSGSGALLAAKAGGAVAKVDVVVTTEPTGPDPGRTYLAATSVPLLAVRRGPEGPGGLAAATLGLTRRQALRLIAAESFARKVTVLPAG
ncbi:MAG TPA: SAF domain-containing protein [Solirubrobacterales bacterium]|nr:SAF domain-containing protein [Solirubrobacterales bacterium]